MRAGVVFFVLLAAGCATLESPFEAHLASADEQVSGCARWFEALDRSIDAAGVRDAQDTRVPGFPYLRVNRLLASLRERAAASDAGMRAFASRLAELDLAARGIEIENLPEWKGPRAAALKRTEDCSQVLRSRDLDDARARTALLSQADVPDDYSAVQRALGLYWLTRIPFAQGVRRWEAQTREVFSNGSKERPAGVRYAPPAQPALARETVGGLLARARLDPLGVPELSEREVELIAAAYAPSFEIVLGGDFDRFGEVRWRPSASLPEVDATLPVVYVHAAHTRMGGEVLLQIVYTLWFPERPHEGALDILAGRYDALHWRVTLSPRGEPLVYDSIHACGCYHQFFPTAGVEPRPAPRRLEEWAFVPARLPRLAQDERPLVRIASGTHYLAGIDVVRGTDSLVRYEIRPYAALRSLPLPRGGHRSAFGPDGLMPASERTERFLFWPMGIASAGAMRQWGRHATAFVGRRHFDDADLIERRFAVEGR